MKAVYNNSCIECNSAEIISRKIVPSAFLELKSVGKCFTYKCSLNSEATIKKESDPKICKIDNHSLLHIESKLECDRLYVAVAASRPYKLYLINKSGRHKAQTFLTDKFTFARITLQLSNIPLQNPEIAISPVDTIATDILSNPPDTPPHPSAP